MSTAQDDKSNPSISESAEGEKHYSSIANDLEDNDLGKKCISVGDYLPYGLRMFYETSSNVVRMKDIGEKNRVLVIGVLGSFTPDCWNRHFFQVLEKLRYYQERNVAHICCISTNDPYTHLAWGTYLGCQESVLMWSDVYKHFTQKIGMDIVVPWLDNTIRSKRYVLLADDMVVTKIIVAQNDESVSNWDCSHLALEYDDDDIDDDDI